MGKHHQRICSASQGGAQGFSDQGSDSAAQGETFSLFPPTIVLLHGPVCREGPTSRIQYCNIYVEVLASVHHLQTSSLPERVGGNTGTHATSRVLSDARPAVSKNCTLHHMSRWQRELSFCGIMTTLSSSSTRTGKRFFR